MYSLSIGYVLSCTFLNILYLKDFLFFSIMFGIKSPVKITRNPLGCKLSKNPLPYKAEALSPALIKAVLPGASC